jgi:uncharacterized protein (TIGR03437 family)
MRIWSSAFLVLAALGLWRASAQTVVFDFDTGTPALANGQNIPFDQAWGTVSAHFSSPSGPAFSIQTDASTGWHLSQFSGHYLYANNQNGNKLQIQFNRPMTAITLTFATADFQQVEVPTTLQLVAYLGSTATMQVGAANAHGTYAQDTMPMGTLTFNSTGGPFDLVEIAIGPGQPRGAAAFFVDNVVTTLARLPYVISSASAASYAPGAVLAAGAIATGFGQAMASGTAAAASQPLPTTLANTTVAVTDSAGMARPAPLFYVSATQINYLVPDATATGPATVTVTGAGQITATGTLTIDTIAPGLFTANSDGLGAAAAWAITVAPDGTQTVQSVASCGTTPRSCVTSPIDLGGSGTQVYLALYGTGIRGRSSLAGVTVRIGAVDAPVSYAGAQSVYAGLDQVNALIPAALAGAGEVDLVLTVDGKPANTVRVNIK